MSAAVQPTPSPPAPSSSTAGPINRTRQENPEPKGKRVKATGARNPYSNPLPLFYHPHHGGAALLYSLVWSFQYSCQALLGALQDSAETRNRVQPEGYLPEQMTGYWDPDTRSVWVLPQRRMRKKKHRQAAAVSRTTRADVGPEHGDDANKSVREEEGREEKATDSPASTGVAQDAAPLDMELVTWMQQLWRYGFFGKGSLSRSEPTWWQREKNRVTGEHGKAGRWHRARNKQGMKLTLALLTLHSPNGRGPDVQETIREEAPQNSKSERASRRARPPCEWAGGSGDTCRGYRRRSCYAFRRCDREA